MLLGIGYGIALYSRIEGLNLAKDRVGLTNNAGVLGNGEAHAALTLLFRKVNLGPMGIPPGST